MLSVRCIDSVSTFHVLVVIRPIGKMMLTLQTTVWTFAGVLSSMRLYIYRDMIITLNRSAIPLKAIILYHTNFSLK